MKFLINACKWFIRFLLKLFVCIAVLSVVLVLSIYFLTTPPEPEEQRETIVNDVTGLNAIPVVKVLRPSSEKEIVEIVKSTTGPISIGGGRFSMGGQTASEDSVHLDLRGFNKVIELDTANKRITVESGIRWRDIQEKIDPHNLSVKIMQSYSNFTVGGTLSVNAHGRYVGYGAVVHTVKGIHVVLADGAVVAASREKNPEIFYGAIGGYGALGVITHVTLDLEDNRVLERVITHLPPQQYASYFSENIRKKSSIVMHNADMVPPDYDTMYVVNWETSTKPVTVSERLQKAGANGFTERITNFAILNRHLRSVARKVYEFFRKHSTAVVYRNYEASYDVSSLGTIADRAGSYVLQEYFIPVDSFASFRSEFLNVLKRNKVDVVNISVRHAEPDERTYLTWSPKESFAFVLYYYQDADSVSRKHVGEWTREAIEVALKHGGTYYLPYQTWASNELFHKSYPRAVELFQLKNTLDPEYRYRNSLWNAYYKPTMTRQLLEKSFHIADFHRPEDQTFLTVPEWFLVYASEEQAAAYEHQTPTEFRYFGSLFDFWTSYLNVISRTRLYYTNTNWGYHFMNAVAGTSTTIEYLLKGVYENTFGRFSALFAYGSNPVEEFIGQVYREYSNFIQQKAWFHFDFRSKAKELARIPAEGFRATERKYSFLVELWAKHYLSFVFRGGVDAIYDPVQHATYVTAKGELDLHCQPRNDCAIVSRVGDRTGILKLPRYRAFKDSFRTLRELQILNIAGNKQIVVSLLVAPACVLPAKGEELFNWPVLKGATGTRRVGVVVPVSDLHDYFSLACLEVEHVYDY